MRTDPLDEVDGTQVTRGKPRGSARDCLVPDDVQRQPTCPCDPRSNRARPLRCQRRLVGARLDLDRASLPHQRRMRLDALNQPKNDGPRGSAAVFALLRPGLVDLSPRERTRERGYPQWGGARGGPARRALGHDRGDVGHVRQLERAHSREYCAPGDTGQGRGPGIAQDIRGVGRTHASQRQTNVHVGAHRGVDRPRRALRRGDQVQAEAAALSSQTQQDVHRGRVGVGQDAELVDGDDEARGRLWSAGGILLVCALPGRQIRHAQIAQRRFTPCQDRGNPVQGTRRGPRVQVGEQCLRVWEVRQAREGGAALVIDEDETHGGGRIAVSDGGEPAEQRLRLA